MCEDVEELVEMLDKVIEESPTNYNNLQEAMHSADKNEMYRIGRDMGYVSCAQDVLYFLFSEM